MSTGYKLKVSEVLWLLRAASLRHRKQIAALVKAVIRKKGEGFRYFDETGTEISLSEIHRRSQADAHTRRSVYNLWFFYTR